MYGRLTMLAVLFIGMTAFPAVAGQRVELQEGVVIQGEILSLDGSTCALRTGGLGRATFEKSKVRTAQMSGPATGARQSFQDLKNRIMANPESMRMILELQDDPDVQAVLNDPEIMSAADAGDLDRLLSNPKVIKLLQNPAVQEIGKGLINSPAKPK